MHHLHPSRRGQHRAATPSTATNGGAHPRRSHGPRAARRRRQARRLHLGRQLRQLVTGLHRHRVGPTRPARFSSGATRYAQHRRSAAASSMSPPFRSALVVRPVPGRTPASPRRSAHRGGRSSGARSECVTDEQDKLSDRDRAKSAGQTSQPRRRRILRFRDGSHQCAKARRANSLRSNQVLDEGVRSRRSRAVWDERPSGIRGAAAADAAERSRTTRAPPRPPEGRPLVWFDNGSVEAGEREGRSVSREGRRQALRGRRRHRTGGSPAHPRGRGSGSGTRSCSIRPAARAKLVTSARSVRDSARG